MNTPGISAISGSAAQVANIAATRPVGFNAAALRNAPATEQRKQVAAQFEAVLVRQLLGKTMTSLLSSESSGVAGSVYGDMLADTLAQQLTAGQGMGLGRFLEQQLAPKGAAATDVRAEEGKQS